MHQRAGRQAVAVVAVVALGALAACGSSAEPNAGHGARTTSPARTTTVAPTTTTVAPTTTTAPSGTGWTTYGGGVDRRSSVSAPAFVRAPSAVWTSPSLDGAVYGQPLVYGGTVLVATENDTVYGLDETSGAITWSVHLGTPMPAGDAPCGDIAPTIGVTSTMVLDPASGTVFASAAVVAGGAVRHDLVAVSTRTHQVLWTLDLDQPGWSAPAQLQRAALALSAGRILVGFGGNYGDCGAYNGWVVSAPESGTGPLAVYRVPTAREGAVWAPGGVTVDSTGTIFAATGNGSAGPGQAFDHGNAVIALTPAMGELGFFAPADWAQDNASDADLGSTAPIALGDGRLFIVGKQATAFLLSAAALGGIGHPLASLGLCNSRGANAFDGSSAFVVCTDDGTLVQVVIGTGNTMARGWTWHSPTGGAGSPTVAGGVVWSVDPGASVLYGVDEGNGTTRYAIPLRTGTPTHFAAAAYADGLLVVAGTQAVEALR
ncbi:MAG TPA: PQQ-binding-like beta-propeller repeat protein [Acidimicrobiales bacterium]|nr:PQQ-binding-like beta-propeller repeat protein [Acidimicrobiales bacterium]